MDKLILVGILAVIQAGCAAMPQVLLDVMWGDAKVHVEQGQEENK